MPTRHVGPSATGRTAERQTGGVNRASGIRPSPVFLVIVAVAVLGGVLLAFFANNSVVARDTGSLLLILGGWGTSLCLHEFGHAYVAYKGGDYSVRGKGYLTLDIRRYTSPLFSIVLPLLFLAFGGIPLPGGAVWVNHQALRSRRIETWVSLAGPGSNLVIGIVLTEIVRSLTPSYLTAGLSYLALLQILAFVLNILPIPGLDGWGALEPWLGPEAKRFGDTVRPWAPLVLFFLLIGVASVSEAFFNLTYHVFTGIGGNQLLSEIGQADFLFWRQ
jgi:Zn-dependent protease